LFVLKFTTKLLNVMKSLYLTTKLHFLVLLMLIAAKGFSEEQKPSPEMINSLDRKFFIENKGQWHSDVLYLCRMGGLDAWITKYGVNYTFYKLEEAISTERKEHAIPDKFEHKDYNMIGHRVLMKLQNYSPNPATESKEKQEGYYNYFIGNDPSKHASYVGLYKEAVVKNVYNGIDLRYYFDKGGLRYDYVVHPGADPAQIVFTLEGSDKTYVNEKGNLVFTTRFGEVAMAELRTFQAGDGKVVQSRFVRKDNGWGITVGKYACNQALVIDPLIYSTYIGGSSWDQGNGIAVDGSGNAYVTGFTKSTDYDVTAGAFQTTGGGTYYDVFVTKLNASGSGLVYSTYIGGSGDDEGYGIDIDGSGNAYVTGYTKSTDYDITAGAFQTTHGGNKDVFVTKLNASGSGLLYSTYIGGNDYENGYGIAIDGSGNAYVTGYTYSSDYDVTAGAFQTTYGGNIDVFVTKLNASGSGLLYSTYIGGSGEDRGYGIAVDGSGNAYVTGYTTSTNYDVTPGAFQTTHGGGFYDVFVTKLNASGSSLVYSTYIGGGVDDQGYGIAVDGSGNAYVTGWTESGDYDVTAGAFKTTKDGFYDVFVTKLNASGSSLVYSTYIGGSNRDFGYGIAVDGSGNAYVTGSTSSTDYDVTAGAFQTILGGGYDVFVTKLCPCNPLPIELLYFEAQSYYESSANKVLLIWETATERNNDYFTIERSKDAIHFDELCKIKGAGNSYHNISYQFIDENPYEGISYYRLKQTDYDGKFKYSFIIAVTIKFERGGRYSVYPNPSYGTFTLQTEKGGEFELMDIHGRVLQVFKMQNPTQQIQVSLPNGMYFIREKASGATQKLIIE
jgi:hypothetical protein